jgi:hypothetical protein
MSRNKSNVERPILRFSDIALIVILLCCGVASIFFLHKKYLSAGDSLVAEVRIAGELISTRSLGREEPERLIPLQLPRGEGTVQIKEGKIRILPMPDGVCPLHICSNTGWIDRPDQFIACVPNKLIITIHTTQPTEPDSIDAVTY